MKWNLKMNGKLVTWQIADTVAVMRTRETPPPSVDHFLESVADIEDDPAPLDRGTRDRRAFERAGWKFVEPSAPLPPPDDGGGEPLPDEEVTRPVFITEKGNVLIGSDVATVQLKAAAITKEKTAEKILAEDGLTMVHQLSFAPYLYAVRLPSNRPLRDVIDALQAKTNRYVFAEPSVLQQFSGRQDPNDPKFADQWHHGNGVGLHSVDAWETSTGAGVRIAIIDNGMDINHEDLKNAIVGGGFFKSDGPGTGTASFVRFEPGMNGFIYRGHGTLCMGVAGARQNNQHGGCGIAPDSELIAIAFALDLIGNQLVLARTIEFALDPKKVDPESDLTRGADIISCSLGTPSVLESVLAFAIEAAASARGGLGVPIFWAVDNEPGLISDDTVCSLPNVIAVGSSNKNGFVRTCARGPELEFLAPGELVLGPSVATSYLAKSGTSFATPLAAGVAALVMSKNPELTAEQVLQRLRDSCDMPPHDPDEDDRYGHGRLNAHRAVQ